MSFVAQITADISNFENNIKRATNTVDSSTKKMQSQFDKLGDSFVKIGAKASIFSAAVVGATVGLVKMGISAGDASADINNLSTATSLSTDLIQELSYVASASNSSFEGLQGSMDSFQRRLKTVGEEGSRVNEMFGKLGVSTTDASGKVRSMDDVLLDTFNKLGDMEEGLAKNAIGAELFGRRWNEVALIVSSGSKGIAELREEANKLGLVLDENTLQSSDDFATAMGLVGFQIDTLKTKIGASLVPILQESVLPLLQDKIIPAVSRFADFIAQLSEKFNALSPSTKGAIFAITGIATAIGPLLLGLGGLLKILPLIGAGFTAMTGPIGIAVAAIAGAAILIVKNWDSIKEYFTTGGGSELFESIKNLFNTVKNVVSDVFSNIKNTITTIWNAIGDTLIKVFGNSFDTIMTVVTTAVNIVSGVLNTLINLLKGDFSGALESIKTLATNVFDGFKNIVFNSLSSMTSALSEFFSFLGLNSLADTFADWSEKIKPTTKKIVDDVSTVNDEIEQTAVVVDTTTQSITKLAEANERVVESLKAMRMVIPQKEVYSLFNELFTQSGNELILNPVIEPNIDSDTLKSKMYESVKSGMGDLSEGIEVISIDLTSMLSSTLTDMFGAVSNAIMNGDSVIDALGASLLGTLGGIMVQLGQMVIVTGKSIEAVKVALKSLGGIGAIAAGAALIAIGSAFSAGARKIGSSMGSGGGYSSAPSMQNSQPTLGNSDYRGAYQDDLRVEFKIGGNELVGVLDTANQRRNRLG